MHPRLALNAHVLPVHKHGTIALENRNLTAVESKAVRYVCCLSFASSDIDRSFDRMEMNGVPLQHIP
jgi:hypothetical protein